MRTLLLFLIILFSACNGVAQTGSPTLWEQAATGNKPGLSLVNLFGTNGTLSGDREPLWPESNTGYTWLTANMSSPTISSDSTDDAAAGTGARTVSVTCVAADYEVTTGTYAMNGQTGVSVTQNCMAVNKIEVLTVGADGANAGTIYVGTGSVTTGKPAVVHGIAISRESESFMYTVPADYTLLCRNFQLSSYGATAAQTVRAYLHTSVDSGPIGITSLGAINQGGSSVLQVPNLMKFSERTKLLVSVQSAASSGPAIGSAECLLILDSWLTSGQRVL